MNKRTSPSILQTFDTEEVGVIAENREITKLDALRLFLASETQTMLVNDNMKLWHLK